MKTSHLIVALLLSATLGACASYQAQPAAPAMASNGVLTDANGMTLYIFDKDAAGSGKSVCNGPCATNWPPLYAQEGDRAEGDYSIIVRDDGKKQWALKGKPLYHWAKDKKPGDTTGDGFKDVWHAAKP